MSSGGGRHEPDNVRSLLQKLPDDVAFVDDLSTEPDVTIAFFTSAGELRRHIRRLADQVTEDHGRARAVEQRAASELTTWTSPDGMGHLRATLDPEWFASLTNAINREASAMAGQATDTGEPITKGRHLDAAALIELVQSGNGRKGRPELLVVVDVDTITTGPHDQSVRETRDGRELSYDTITRLACDSMIRRVVLDERGVPIDVGRGRRTAGDAQCA